MLVDANLLLYAIDENSTFHEPARTWLAGALNGPRRVGLPWESLSAFLRIGTHPRAAAAPLSSDEAWEHVDDWLSSPAAWVPQPTASHAQVFGSLIRRYQLRANMVADAHLAAIAIQHGLTIYSADTDFARFTEVAWENPLVPND